MGGRAKKMKDNGIFKRGIPILGGGLYKNDEYHLINGFGVNLGMNDKEDFLDSINFEQKLKEFDKLYNDLKRAKENEKRYRQSSADMGFSSQFYRISEEIEDYLHWFDSQGRLQDVEEKYPSLTQLLSIGGKKKKLPKKKEYALLLQKYIKERNTEPMQVKRELWDDPYWSNPSKYLDEGLIDIGKTKDELRKIYCFSWLP